MALAAGRGIGAVGGELERGRRSRSAPGGDQRLAQLEQELPPLLRLVRDQVERAAPQRGGLIERMGGQAAPGGVLGVTSGALGLARELEVMKQQLGIARLAALLERDGDARV